jgi:uncharacterized cupredoxin-like copper-binding protein
MQMSDRRVLRAVGLASVLALVAAGCGGTDKPTTKAAVHKAPSTTQKLSFDAGEMYFKPTTVTAKAGKATFVLKNSGVVVHELIVLKTDAAIGSLTPGADKRVSEDSSVGEVSETDPGETKSADITLTPGNYLIVCNIPGHYAAGMRAKLVVT